MYTCVCEHVCMCIYINAKMHVYIYIYTTFHAVAGRGLLATLHADNQLEVAPRGNPTVGGSQCSCSIFHVRSCSLFSGQRTVTSSPFYSRASTPGFGPPCWSWMQPVPEITFSCRNYGCRAPGHLFSPKITAHQCALLSMYRTVAFADPFAFL